MLSFYITYQIGRYLQCTLYILLWNKFKNNDIKTKKNIRSHTNTKNVLVFSASLGKMWLINIFYIILWCENNCICFCAV